jgi:rhamnulokinase
MDKIDFRVLAFDIGASSGRAMVGTLIDNQLKLDELYRFPNEGVRIFDSLYWNILNIFQEIKKSLSLYVDTYGSQLESIGIDTWGVDFVLLDEKDELVGPVYHYRDKRTEGILEQMLKDNPKEIIFNQTGIQFIPINSSIQLYSMVLNHPEKLNLVKSFLMIPDYLNYLLTKIKVSEYSIATTSQLYNPIKKNWAYDIIQKLGLNPTWFQKVVSPGTIIEKIHKNVADEVKLDKETKIISPLSHDTGSAVAAVPVDMKKYERNEWAYISSGTWSLMGVELEAPLINKKSFAYNFTNEGGIEGTIRLLKNLTGLWLIQECKHLWNLEGANITWEDIEKEAKTNPPFNYFINIDDPLFLNPPNMIKAIQDYCKRKNEKIPKTIGQISRAIFEGLAFRYRYTFDQLEDLIEKKLKIVHIIGGGSQNSLLNQFTANILNVPIKAGPIEATAIGNILVQALGVGKIKSVPELRNIVRNSFEMKDYIPEGINDWNNAYNIYLKVIKD